MNVFDRLQADGYEQVVFCHDQRSGLRAIVAIHSTRLGPALGGTRFQPYPTEEEAMEDVLRLAKAMTFKAAAAGLDLGGGKAVILGDPNRDKTEALMRAYGRFVNSLGGRYVTAEDVGTTEADMNLIRRETTRVTGVSVELGGSGDPSSATAYGVLWAMKAVGARLWGSTSLEGRHVVVAGVGKVGSDLAGRLVEEHARVTVADVVPAAVERVTSRHRVEVAPAELAHALPCDIFSPCALGGVLDQTRIRELRCSAVVGAANNQLADASCGKLLAEVGVLYGPDYVVNAGGIINIAEELSPSGYQKERAFAAVRRIFDTTSAVVAMSETEGITTAEAADRMAERRLDEVGEVTRIRTFGPPG